MKTLTTTEAAALIGCNESRVRQLLIAGTLAGAKRGRDWFVNLASATAYKNSERKPGRKPAKKSKEK